MSEFSLLITRSIQPELKAYAAEYGIRVTENEFISIEHFGNPTLREEVKNLLKESLYVIFTSGNAVKYFLNGDQRIPDEGGTTAAKELTADHQAASGALFSPDWKIFCVQGSTSETVAALFGRERIVATATSAFALSEVIIDHLKREKDERSLVFFCGNRRRDEIPRACKTNGVPLKEVIVYQTIPMSKVITEEYNAIAFFSPSTVESYFSLNSIPEDTLCFSIGTSTTHSLRQHTDNMIITAAEASEKSIIDAVISRHKHKK